MYFESEIAKEAYETYKYDLELVRTVSKVPGNPNYYEKDGLRTYGDGQDHEKEPTMTFSRFMALTAMALLWSGSQIPLYLFGSVLPVIMADIGGADRYVWILLANLIPLASITPFVGALSDLFGRRWVAIAGASFLVVGCIIAGTAKNMNVLIGGQVLIGIGAGINELTALAVAGELAPTSKRGLYVGGMVCTILPYCPSGLYAQLVAENGSWRYLGLWCGLWSLLGLILTVIFYRPGPRANSTGLSRMEIAKRIDYVGGILSTAGLTLFLAALTWAGNQYQWRNPHVVVNLVLGIILIIAFIVWEFFAPYPMFPARLKQNPRALYLILFITFVSGSNFLAVLAFWTTEYQLVYGRQHDAVFNGLGSLPVGFCIIGGAVIFSILITISRGKIKWIMVFATVVMTAGSGGIAGVRVDNLDAMWFPVILACLGVGATIIPNQIIATIICPDDLIATITACTLSIRIVGAAVGYAVYYNVLYQRFTDNAYVYIVPAAIKAGVYDPDEIRQIAVMLADNLKDSLLGLPGIVNQQQVDLLIRSGQETFAASADYVYYISIAFGGAAIVASCFLPDLSKYFDNHVAVAYL